MTFRPRRSRWDAPPPLDQVPDWHQPIRNRPYGSHTYYDDTGTTGSNQRIAASGQEESGAPPPGTGTDEKDGNEAHRDHPQQDGRTNNRGQSYASRRGRGSRPRPFRGTANYRPNRPEPSGQPLTSDQYRYDRRNFGRRPFGNRCGNANFRPPHWTQCRGGQQYGFPFQSDFREEMNFYQNPFPDESHVVFSNGNWVEARDIEEKIEVEKQQEAKEEEKEKAPVLGSDEERKLSVKATTEWLKSRLKNKDTSEFDSILQEKIRQETSEPPSRPACKDIVEALGSALDSPSIESVKKKLSSPEEEPLQDACPPLLKDPNKEEKKPRLSRCDLFGKLKTDVTGPKPAPVTSGRMETSHQREDPPKLTCSPTTARKPNVSTSTRPRIPPESPRTLVARSEQKEKLLQIIREKCNVTNIGQLKYKLANPRPGKFEFYLKELIKRYSSPACREVRLTADPFSGAENLHTEINREKEGIPSDFFSNLEFADCAVDVNDLPLEFVKGLGDMLGLDFMNSVPEEIPLEIPIEGTETPIETVDLLDSPPAVNTEERNLTSKPEIRIKDFARLGDVTQKEPVDSKIQRKDNARGEGAPHPLRGPNLLAAAAATADRPVRVEVSAPAPPAPAEKPNPSPPKRVTFQRGRRFPIVEQEVFFTAEDTGKKKVRNALNASTTRATRKNLSDNSRLLAVDLESDKEQSKKDKAYVNSPDSTSRNFNNDDQLDTRLENKSKGKTSSKSKTSLDNSVQLSIDSSLLNSTSEGSSNGEDQSNSERQILARLQEICKEINDLNGRVKKLNEEKARLYSLLPNVTSIQENVNKRKRRNVSSSDSDDAIQEIMKRERAALSKRGSPVNLRSEENDNRNAKKKRAAARSKTSPGASKSKLFGNSEELKLLKKAKAAKAGSLAYYSQNATLHCKFLTGHHGIITQVKVINKYVLAASSAGKVFAFSAKTGCVRRTFDGGKFAVKCFILAEAKSEVRLYFGSDNGNLHCYSLKTGEKVHEAIHVSNEIQCLDSKWGLIYIGTKTGNVMIYNIEEARLLPEALSDEGSPIISVTCLTEGPRKVVVVSSENNKISLRDAVNGLFLRDLPSPGSASTYKCVVDVTLNKVVCCYIGHIYILDYSTGDLIGKHSISSHVSCMCLFKGILFLGCKDGSVRCHDVTKNEEINVLRGSRENVVCIDAIDGKVIIARRGGVFEIFNLSNGTDSSATD